MKKIETLIELKEKIALLEEKQEDSILALKEEFKIAYESLRPINLIKNTFKQLTSVPDFKGGILNTSIGIGAGYLSKKVIIGSTKNPIKQLIGTLLQISITSLVSKNGDGIKLGVIKLLGNLFSKNQPNQ